MIVQDIVAAVIDSAYVTNDIWNIEAASLCEQHVEFVDRAHARALASKTRGTEWEALAEAPALFVIIDGHRYRRTSFDSLMEGKVVTVPLGRINRKRCGEDVPPVSRVKNQDRKPEALSERLTATQQMIYE